MGIKKFLYVIEQYMPIDDKSKRDLLGYYLCPALKKSVQSDRDGVLVAECIDKHNLN